MSSNKQVTVKAIKLGLLGDSRVGKTAICDSLLNLEFSEESIGTIGNVKLDTIFKLRDGNSIKLILWDSAGQERFRSVAMGALKAVKGIVLVFDITSHESFENINMWLKQINEHCNNPCLVLFGNKIDLDQSLRQVTPEEIKKFCNEKNLTYFETSAKTKQGINDGFNYIVNEAYEKAQGFIDTNIVIEPNSNNDNNIVIKNKNDIESGCGCAGNKKKRKKSKDIS